MRKIAFLPRPVWAEINLKNIIYNFTQIRKYIPANIKIMGIVKADAYGHGIKEVAKVLVKCGIDYFGVESLKEALELKEININKPILILGYTEPDFVKEVINNSFRQTVYNKAQLQILDKCAKELNKLAKIHIEIDTGMGRLGVLPNEALDFIRYASELKNIKIEGLFTHFSVADGVSKDDINYTKQQLTIFKNIIDKLEIDIELIHAANSAAILNYKEAYFDLVRCGIMLYGLYPNEKLKNKIKLKPALSVKAKIISVKEFEKGSYISYGRKYKTRKREKIALLPIGYQDGLSRLLSNNGYCLVNDKRCNIVGVICMDYTAINVTNTDAKIGDEVIIIGSGEKEEISADTLAKRINTINYEIVTVIGKMLPRFYLC